MTTTTLRITGIDPAEADALRAAAAREGAPRVRVTTEHSHPCRQCLCDARPGEDVVLVRHDPFAGADSPYTATSPVYLHAEPCGTPQPDGEVPGQLVRRLLSVRAYDGRHLLRGAEVTPGTQLAEVAGRLLDDKHAAYVQVHNAGPGCCAARVERG